ncbi:hypothetical protein Tco_0970802 [Tanacetum coccineum]
MRKMVTHCGDELVIEFKGEGEKSEEMLIEGGVQDIWVKEEENMRRMMIMKKIDGLNNEKGKRKWQSMVLEMKIEEIVCSKKEVPAKFRNRVVKDTKNGNLKFMVPSLVRPHYVLWRSRN